MQLYSTKGQAEAVPLKTAVFKGLPPDNGLYMPETIPQLPKSFFADMGKMSFADIAFTVSQALIGHEVPAHRLRGIVEDTLSFDAPLRHIHDNVHALELFHGPTLAFKDFGARFMSRLMRYFLEAEGTSAINILVATSGDTGSAVAQGFFKVPGIKVTILYPKGKVSKIQEQQLTTIGENVTALEVDGVFDDCQQLVKQAFLDKELNSKLNLTSANSINIARLVPQSFYYFHAWAQVQKAGLPVVFCTPSGNFGNICGGLIAWRMGLPVHKFVAATNANAIVPHYLATGRFEPRPSVKTVANAMDVGNPSNFPRLHELLGKDLAAEQRQLAGASFTDEETVAAMREVHQKYGYVMCPHTAIGYLGLRDYLAKETAKVSGIFLATAHPAKFTDVVEPAIGQAVPIPQRLQEIIEQPKNAIELPNDFEALKAFLLR